jgi:hypothetical protein
MLEPFQSGERNLAYVSSVGMDFVRRKTEELADFLDGTRFGQPSKVSVTHSALILGTLDYLSRQKNERATNAEDS